MKAFNKKSLKNSDSIHKKTTKIGFKMLFSNFYLCLQATTCALLDPGKFARFWENVSKITLQMCHFQGKCAIFIHCKCVKGKLIIAIVFRD